MSLNEPDRSLALVLSRLGGQARGRLIEALPVACRDKTLAALEGVDRLDRADMTVVEQVLDQDLDRLLGDPETESDGFREFYPLRVADVLTLVLLKGSPERAAAILPHLPLLAQAECVTAIAIQDWAALENHLGAEERGLIRDLDAWLGKPSRRSRPDFAISILRKITSPRQLRVLLTDIDHRDSEVGRMIQGSLFTIEDLTKFSDRELQVLMRGIDDWDLAIALLGMTDGLKRRILVNVSQRRGALLEEDVAHLADTGDEEIQSVCDRVLLRARMLYETGQVQTYLGSVSSEPEPSKDNQEEDDVLKTVKRAPKDGGEPPVVTKGSLRRIAFGAIGLVLVAGVWFWGIGKSGSRTSSVRARVSVSDFARSQRVEVGAGNLKGASQRGQQKASGVTASDGEVYIVSGSDRRAIDDAPIYRGDVVETGEDSGALISVSDDLTQVEIEAESSLKLGEKDQRTGPPKLSLRVGNIWVLAKNPAMEVHSPVASVVASVGALYRFRVVLSSATTVSVEKGTVWVHTKVGEKELFVVGAGKSLRVYPRGATELINIEDGGRPRWLSFF